MLHKRSQISKSAYGLLPFSEIPGNESYRIQVNIFLEIKKGWGGPNVKGHKEILRFYGNVLYFDCGDIYADVYNCQISLNYVLKTGVVYCMGITP